jgi:hypothetical protein
MSVHDKINMRTRLFAYLEPQQAWQLIERNLIALAPYYNERLRRQQAEVDEHNRFKSVYGCSRWQYENNIKSN